MRCVSFSYERRGFKGLSLPDEKKLEFMGRLMAAGAEECVLLNTCNRFEVYFSGDPGDVEKVLEEAGIGGRLMEGVTALRHLFRVASGLESMLPGERQVLGQVKEAYAFARDAGFSGKELGGAFRRALGIGKKVRSRAHLPSSSLGKLAVELAEREGGVAGSRVFLLGAGKMGSEIAIELERRGASRVLVASRHLEKAKCLEGARRTAVEFADMQRFLVDVDFLFVAANAPHALIGFKDIAPVLKKRRKELVIIDISAPPAVEENVSSLPKAKLLGLVDIRPIIDDYIAVRGTEIREASEMVEKELEALYGEGVYG